MCGLMQSVHRFLSVLWTVSNPGPFDSCKLLIHGRLRCSFTTDNVAQSIGFGLSIPVVYGPFFFGGEGYIFWELEVSGEIPHSPISALAVLINIPVPQKTMGSFSQGNIICLVVFAHGHSMYH